MDRGFKGSGGRAEGAWEDSWCFLSVGGEERTSRGTIGYRGWVERGVSC